jgi:hypothetical protein
MHSDGTIFSAFFLINGAAYFLPFIQSVPIVLAITHRKVIGRGRTVTSPHLFHSLRHTSVAKYTNAEINVDLR